MIPPAVYDLEDGNALAVYAVLRQHANEDLECWPSMKRLEQRLGWSEFRIRPAIKKLVDAGLLEIVIQLEPDPVELGGNPPQPP
jgi:hypothetical protein